MPRVCVFDVNETLLDLAAMDELFKDAFGDPSIRRQWFARMLELAFVHTITGEYQDFPALGRAALQNVATVRGVNLRDEDRDRILAKMRALPAHPDVKPALDRLRERGIRLATLTNSPLAVVEAQLSFAGIRSYFEQVLSADEVRSLKPAPEPYHMAAQRLGVPVGQIMLIAAHSWDVSGALSAGCGSALVTRPGVVHDPLARQPEITAPDLVATAEAFLRVEQA